MVLTEQEQYSLENGILRTAYVSTLHHFRFEGQNTMYNLYDAGNYIWGAWMKLNKFSSFSIWLGSQFNEVVHGCLFDSEADQQALSKGFSHFKD